MISVTPTATYDCRHLTYTWLKEFWPSASTDWTWRRGFYAASPLAGKITNVGPAKQLPRLYRLYKGRRVRMSLAECRALDMECAAFEQEIHPFTHQPRDGWDLVDSLN